MKPRNVTQAILHVLWCKPEGLTSLQVYEAIKDIKFSVGIKVLRAILCKMVKDGRIKKRITTDTGYRRIMYYRPLRGM